MQSFSSVLMAFQFLRTRCNVITIHSISFHKEWIYKIQKKIGEGSRTLASNIDTI